MSQCEPGSWADRASGRCVQCSEACYECSGPGPRNCRTCHGLAYLTPETSCSLSCPHGTHPDHATYECRPCHASCAACSGPGGQNCTACAWSGLLTSGQCDLCPRGKYRDSGEIQCAACHHTCDTCSGPREDNCESCGQGLEFDDLSKTCFTKGFTAHILSSILVTTIWLLGRRDAAINAFASQYKCV